MKYFLKQSGFLFIYNIFMTIIALGILCIQGKDLLWLRMILCVLNIGLYLFIAGMTFYKEGQEALKVRNANDLEREQIIKTGEALPLKIAEEYKPWKGFVMGAIICAPMVIALIVHLILALATNGTVNGAGAVSGLLYMSFFAPVTELLGTETLVWAQYFIQLYAIPIIVVTAGVGYMLGAKKIQAQYDKIHEKQRQIYGDKI
jgi:hypothetical protein